MVYVSVHMVFSDRVKRAEGKRRFFKSLPVVGCMYFIKLVCLLRKRKKKNRNLAVELKVKSK